MNFNNPTGYWEYDGPFSVELVPDTPTDIVPKNGAAVKGNIVAIHHGRIKQTMGGIQLYAYEQPFYWSYSSIKAIRRPDGSLVWLNWNFNEDGSPKSR